MFRSLRARLLLTHMLVAALVLLVVGVALFLFSIRISEVLTIQRLQGLSVLIELRAPRFAEAIASERLRHAFTQLGVRGTRVMVLGRGGEIITDSRPDEEPPPPSVLEDAASTESTHGRYGGLMQSWVYVTQPLAGERTMMLQARRQSFVDAIREESIVQPMLRASLVALAASIVMTWLISRWVAAPLQRTASAARAVAGGDYDQRLAPTGPEEAHSLARSFNEMVQQVQSSQGAMRDFVANVSHELRTPLTSIQGFAQAILDGAASQPQAVEHAAQVIFDESDRLVRLVEDLLDLAKLDTGQAALAREPVDPNALLGAVLERLALKAQEQQILLVDRLEALPELIGDGDRLAQVFTNLIDNAIEHTPSGGTVTLSSKIASGWITVHVEDTGPGIPADELSRIFERFYQLDKARAGGMGRGAGLGLAISREIVQAHQGTLTAQSIMGRGSRFTVRLPVVRPEDETLTRARAS